MPISQKIQGGFVATLTAISVPLMILNLFGGIISGIWLAILGEWGKIFRGIFFVVAASSIAIPIALIPSLIFTAPMAMAMNRGKKVLEILFASLSFLYKNALITIWCIWVMWFFVRSANESSLIPLLIWSYGVATDPWMWLAQKDHNEFAIFSTLFAEAAYIIGMVLFFLGATLGTIAVVFGAIMLIGGVIQIFLSLEQEVR
jgi:hypothetical protein